MAEKHGKTKPSNTSSQNQNHQSNKKNNQMARFMQHEERFRGAHNLQVDLPDTAEDEAEAVEEV